MLPGTRFSREYPNTTARREAASANVIFRVREVRRTALEIIVDCSNWAFLSGASVLMDWRAEDPGIIMSRSQNIML